MITRREAMKIAAIGATAIGTQILSPMDISAETEQEGSNMRAVLRFVAPDAVGTGLTCDQPGNVAQIPAWLEGCDFLSVEFLPGNYSEYISLSDIPETKQLVLHGDPSDRTVFLSTDSSTNGSIKFANCHNVSLYNVHFRQQGRDLKWFLNLVGCKDCLVQGCSWVGLSCRYGAATVQNESERVTVSDCLFEDTGNRGNTGSGAHQLYVSGGGDNATTGYARDIHIVRCTFADHFAGQHLKFKNGSRDCFVDRCTFLRTNGETFGRFLNIRNVGAPNDGYPIVSNIFVLRCLFKDVSGTPSTVVNPAPTGHLDRFVFAQNNIEGSCTGLPVSVR